ncbi:YggT family protein [Granulicatella seriolae]|uniref:YggT family protein n=1 Tax=Granulicatella seriolae TaxID=2967226 RepID=A0ABT1WNI9_9LACT|nr:YggT family protein [Granulicatella seriolae]
MLLSILQIILYAIDLYSIILVAYALMSWLPTARTSSFGQFIRRLVQPYLYYFDRLIPSFGGLSFSVMAGLLFLQLVRIGVVQLFTMVFFR